MHARGLAELARVARRPVLFTWDPATALDTWIVRDYFSGVRALIPDDYRFAHTLARLGDARAEPIPVPHDCRDGVFPAYWGAPRRISPTRCAPGSASSPGWTMRG
jgi:hypothetical protein